MATGRRQFGAALLGGLLLGAPAARAEPDAEETVNGAIRTLDDLRRDKAFGNAASLLRQARAVLIVPRLIKGGFIIGGEGGEGVLMARRRDGRWSDPSFTMIGSASFGLQAGLAQSEMVLLVMTQKGVEGMLRDQFKLGAQAGIAIATLGSGVEGGMSGATPPDLVVWSSSSGLYGGLTIDGSLIRPVARDNTRWYGRPVGVREILFGSVASPRSVALQRQMAALGQIG